MLVAIYRSTRRHIPETIIVIVTAMRTTNTTNIRMFTNLTDPCPGVLVRWTTQLNSIQKQTPNTTYNLICDQFTLHISAVRRPLAVSSQIIETLSFTITLQIFFYET
jgi:hypothetical protein